MEIGWAGEKTPNYGTIERWFTMEKLGYYWKTMVLWQFLPNFWKNYIFFQYNEPPSKRHFSALYFKHSLLNWRLKFMEMTECLQNCRFYRTIISNYSSELKLKLIEKLSKSKDFSAHDLRWENVIFEGCAALSYHCLQRVDSLWKMVNIYSNLLCNLKYDV